MAKPAALRLNKEFKTLYYHGKSLVHPAMILYVRRNKRGGCRLGITTGKKLGCAVKRNRCRRVIREAYRLLLPRITGGYDIVVVARARMLPMKSTEVRLIMEKLFSRAGLLP